ncbi:hypothetical protein DPSP01_014757 [Paraphaeosphaeria sporulosa]
MANTLPSQARVRGPELPPSRQIPSALPHAPPTQHVAQTQQETIRPSPFPTRARRRQWTSKEGIWDVSEWNTLVANFPAEIREYFRVWEEQDEREREEEVGVEAVGRRRRVEGRYVRWGRYWEDCRVDESGLRGTVGSAK